MNRIIKVALVAFVGVLGFNANAQDLGVTVKGGVNFNSLSLSVSGEDAEENPTEGLKGSVGFHLGASYEIPVNDLFSVEAGLLFDTRGFKIEITQENDFFKSESKGSMNFYSFNIPVVAKVKFPVSDNIKLFAQAGLYAEILLSGKENSESTRTFKSTGETRTQKNSESVKFGKYTEEGEEIEGPSRFGYGLTFGAGAEINKFVLQLGYDLGLKDYDQNENISQKFNAFKVSVGYKF